MLLSRVICTSRICAGSSKPRSDEIRIAKRRISLDCLSWTKSAVVNPSETSSHPDTTVLIADERIAEVGPSRRVKIPPVSTLGSTWNVKGETREQWKKLCEQAADEQDPEKLMEDWGDHASFGREGETIKWCRNRQRAEAVKLMSRHTPRHRQIG